MDAENKSIPSAGTTSLPESNNFQKDVVDLKSDGPAKERVSNDTKTIVTVILLVFAYPIGFIVMWVWAEWPFWLKTLISIPVILLIIFFFSLASYFRYEKQNSRSVYPTTIFYRVK